jgi:hypothetical protein
MSALIACSLLPALLLQPIDGPPHQAPAVRLLDVTGDGALDKLTLGADGSLAVAVHVGRRQFRPVDQVLPRVLVQDVLVSDLDGDGSSDLYLVSPAANVVLTGDGTGYFTDETARFGLADGGPGLSAERLDLDGDGLHDLLLHNTTGDVLFWARADGTFDRDADTPASGAGPAGGAVGVAGRVADPAQPAGPITPPLTLSSGPTIGSGGTMGVDLRASGADSRRPDATGTVPPLVIFPALLSSLEDLFVNDDGNEVDSADVIDGSLTGPDVSTSIGNVGIGTLSPAEKLHVLGNARFENDGNGRTIEIDGNGEIESSSTLYLNRYSSSAVAIAEGGGSVRFGPNSGLPTLQLWSGNVGIGTSSPDYRLEVYANDQGISQYSPSHFSGAAIRTDASGGALGTTTNDPLHLYTNNSQPRVTLDTSGRLGVGTNVNPGRPLDLHANGQGFRHYSPTHQTDVSTYCSASGGWIGTYSQHPLHFYTGNSNEQMTLTTAGRLGIGTTNPGTTLDVNGAITIRGGADIVESFESSCGVLEPGTVVAIDPDHPGQLMCSAQAYDTKVAGVVSGAGGVNPGLLLGQDDMFSGDTKVAMTGRVYVKCTTEGGPVRPGDRLTTSSLDGHAMRVADGPRADGAVIGKAMSSLDEGTGLVLVLVNLQ